MALPLHHENLADWAMTELNFWLERLHSKLPLDEKETHSIRLTAKKLRAAWLLTLPLIGETRCHLACQEMKQLADHFAANRDSTVQSQLVSSLLNSSSQDNTAEWENELREQFFTQSCTHQTNLDESPRELIQSNLSHWQSCRDFLNDIQLLRPGLKQTRKKLRHKLTQALKSGSMKQWHQCRKWLKYFYYQKEILAEMESRQPGKSIERLRELGRVLGKRHDLHNLLTMVSPTGLPLSGHQKLDLLRNRATQNDAELNQKATALARKILE
ncbi:hypothetical protein Rhal01_00833 [Rubritalea halochordaticola]|uniref:CHAD domain-containing protein n=1 Tax=Rubritalea halochordaticola TaxID=714537 RepID=A0ABP9UW88_9BACT